MSQQTYVRVSGVIFTVVALMHALRLIEKWDILIGGWAAPAWASAVAVVVAGYMAYSAIRIRTSF